MQIIMRNPADLIPYEKNAKKHDEKQIKNVARSIEQYGFAQPVVIDTDNVIVIGHCRVLAALRLKLKEIPCVCADHLTPEQVNALRVVDNKSNESDWDMDILADIFADLDLDGFDFEFDFDKKTEDDYIEEKQKEFEERIKAGEIDEGDEEYQEFVEKFEPKKTTDDCYTPDPVYNAVSEWCSSTYGTDPRKYVRPFYPGGDYKSFRYPKDCVVVDNPPFSIISEICRFYCENEIKFFLFAPALTLFGIRNGCKISTQVSVTYANGAVVATSFVTNLDEAEAKSAPDLYKAVKAADEESRAQNRKEIPKYSYPPELVTASVLGQLSRYGEKFILRKDECVRVGELDAQKKQGKAIFGGGYLIAEKAAAEKAAAEKWPLSEREKDIVKGLSRVTE